MVNVKDARILYRILKDKASGKFNCENLLEKYKSGSYEIR
jgi:hypothetical protein